jgi:hypothetical protein
MFVYFIKTQARPAMVKIGKAKDPTERLADMQTGCPYDLVLIGVIKCRSDMHARGVEQRFHHLFRFSRVRGEWFRYSHRIRSAIDSALDSRPDRLGDAVHRSFVATRRDHALRRLPDPDGPTTSTAP